MPEIQGIEKLFSCLPRKRFGLFNQYGTSQYGHSVYGETDIYFLRTVYGISNYGIEEYGDSILLSGIYRTDNVTGRTKYYREPYYITKNPRLPDQQANRQKFADAIVGWQGLTQEQKNLYNKRAIGRHMSGYNLYIREYMYG